MSFGKALICAVALLASGCVTAPPQAPSSSSRPADVGAPDRRDEAPSATTALLRQARADRAAGHLASAESAIERALRIAPNDPWLWIELGEIKRAAGDAGQASAMGRKALSLGAGDRAVEARAAALLER